MTETVLIVEDNRSHREMLALDLEELGFEVAEAGSAAEARKALARTSPALVILDMQLPDMSRSIDFIPELKKATDAPVVMVTAHHDMETTILAIKAGAFDYVHKPINAEEFRRVVDRAMEVRRLSSRTGVLALQSGGAQQVSDMVGKTPGMQAIFKEIGKVAQSRATVLIQGESGTGKELIARIIHNYSTSTRPFVAINCSAIVDTLLESELFGHEKGAFTGAVTAKIGKFEMAEDGTIFLDEIGEMSKALQAKLLRVLQEREMERVGGVKRIPLRARIITATNRDLGALVKEGRFRDDLYQRLKVVNIDVPPLRERRPDIPLLVQGLLARINEKVNKRVTKVPQEVLDHLVSLPWPGNVRELENVLTRAVVLAPGEVLLKEHLPLPAPAGERQPHPQPHVRTLAEAEREAIALALESTAGHKGRACALLGISRPTLERKLKKYALQPPR